MILDSKYFLYDVDENIESEVVNNTSGELLIVQVTGNANNYDISILGTSDSNKEEYIKLQTINVNDFSVSNKIMKNGIYQIDISAIRKIKATINSIDGGTISVLYSIKEG